LFVTWKKRHGHGKSEDWRLRGCIGTFSPKELVKGLKEYAVISAYKDSRFSPLKPDEIPLLRCDVSILTNFEDGESYRDWTVGTHGITIEFESGGRHYNATYLPEVAAEQGWSIDETIVELIHKSGYRGTVNNALKEKIALTRYQSSKASLTYTDYLHMKQKAA